VQAYSHLKYSQQVHVKFFIMYENSKCRNIMNEEV